MQLQLRDLINVSNNSQLTNIVFNHLNNKLDDREKRDFFEWLKIVSREKENESRSSLRRLRGF